MTAANGKPWHDFNERADDLSMCRCGVPGLVHEQVYPNPFEEGAVMQPNNPAVFPGYAVQAWANDVALIRDNGQQVAYSDALVPQLRQRHDDMLRALLAWHRLADAPDVWDSSVPPGGYVCAACGMPTESEPCRGHQFAAYEACNA